MAKHRKIRRYTHSYRTRRRRRRNLMRLLLIILILAALALVGYSISMSLDRLSEESSSVSEEIPSSEPSSEVTEEPESSLPEPEPEPVVIEDPTVRAILMPKEVMLNDAERAVFLENIDTELYNTVVLPLKDSSGRIWYQTEVEHAAICGALSEEAVDASALLAEIEAFELDASAMIWSLQDDWASHAMYGTSYMYQNQPDVTWLDNSAEMGGKSWLNPYLPATQEYLADIAEELSGIGFDEIFVFGNHYPTTFNQRGMGLGNQNGVSQADALENVLTVMQQAAGETRIIPAYMGDCYAEGVRPHVYTTSPNSFAHVPSAPIAGTDLNVLGSVTADNGSIVPVIDDSALIQNLTDQGIEQYFVR